MLRKGAGFSSAYMESYNKWRPVQCAYMPFESPCQHRRSFMDAQRVSRSRTSGLCCWYTSSHLNRRKQQELYIYLHWTNGLWRQHCHKCYAVPHVNSSCCLYDLKTCVRTSSAWYVVLCFPKNECSGVLYCPMAMPPKNRLRFEQKWSGVTIYSLQNPKCNCSSKNNAPKTHQTKQSIYILHQTKRIGNSQKAYRILNVFPGAARTGYRIEKCLLFSLLFRNCVALCEWCESVRFVSDLDERPDWVCLQPQVLRSRPKF